MAIEVKIPQISEGVDTAQVVEILVSEGDSIKKEQSIIAVETDKASVEVPSSDGGKVKEIKVKEGDEVKVGDVILILEEENGKEEDKKKDKEKDKKEEKKEEKEKDKKGDQQKKKEEEEDEEEDKEIEEDEDREEEKDQDEEEKEKEEDTKKEPEDEEKAKDEDQEVPASPSIRRLAREIGVDITKVEGSGPGGRITEKDVKSQSKEKEGKAVEKTELPDFSQWGATSKESLSNIRKTTAKNMTAAWQTVPHVFQFDEADISGIEEYMEENQETAEKAGGKLTITAILVKVMANALQQFPMFNASIDMENEEVIFKKYFHIGIAVDTDKGLLVPVIRDVNKKSIIELATEITELAEKTREGKLSPEEMEGGNITISNLGGIGGTNFTPIVYPPQVAILGVSRAKQQPVFLEGSFEPRQILPLSLSYDHRLIDGADGAKFLRWICQALEDPYKALLGA